MSYYNPLPIKKPRLLLLFQGYVREILGRLLGGFGLVVFCVFCKVFWAVLGYFMEGLWDAFEGKQCVEQPCKNQHKHVHNQAFYLGKLYVLHVTLSSFVGPDTLTPK